MCGKMAVILYLPSTIFHSPRHLLFRKNSHSIYGPRLRQRYPQSPHLRQQQLRTSSSMASGLNRLEDRANRSGSDSSIVRVYDSFSCSSDDDARCAKSECTNDSGDDQVCVDRSEESCSDPCEGGDHVFMCLCL